MKVPWPQEHRPDHRRARNSLLHRSARAVYDLELYGWFCLALEDRCTLLDMTRSKYVDDLLASEITNIFSKFKAD